MLPTGHIRVPGPCPPAMSILLAVLVLASGCSRTSRTPLMEATTPKELSSQEMRGRLYNVVIRHRQIVANTADLIRLQSDDPELRKDALMWKMAANTNMLAAAFRMDPVLGLADAWGYSVQMRNALDRGSIAGLFGPHQPMAVQAYHRVDSLFTALAGDVLLEPERIRPAVEAWAREHPLEDLAVGRVSLLDTPGGPTLDEYRSSAFGTAEMQASMEDLNARAPLLVDNAVDKAIWNLELILEDRHIDENVGRIAGAAGRIDTSLASLNRQVTSVASLLAASDSLLHAVEAQMVRVMADVDRQRVETLHVLQGERDVILTTLDANFDDLLAAVTVERMAVLAAVDSVAALTVEQTVVGLESVVDRAFLRLVQLLVLTAVLVLVVGWILLGRSRGGARGARPA